MVTKNLYGLAWVFLAGTALVSILTGVLTPAALLAFSLTALVLVYALGLWTVVVSTRKIGQLK